MTSAGLPYGLQAMLKEGHRHFAGVDEAVLKNIEACKAIASCCASSMGPNGECRMVVRAEEVVVHSRLRRHGRGGGGAPRAGAGSRVFMKGEGSTARAQAVAPKTDAPGTPRPPRRLGLSTGVHVQGRLSVCRATTQKRCRFQGSAQRAPMFAQASLPTPDRFFARSPHIIHPPQRHPALCTGMKKIVINHLDKTFVTADAATILSELEVEHPAARLLVHAAKAQQAEVGDGANLVVALAGELLAGAEALLRDGLHPSEVADGYAKTAAQVRGSGSCVGDG
jgi:hypothetical protein